MHLLANDIILRKYKDENTLWVSQRLIMQVCQVSKEYLDCCVRPKFKKSIQKGYKYGNYLPNTGNAWRWAKVNGTFYYDYDCLPDRKPTYYRSKLGTRHELLQAYEALLNAKNMTAKEALKNKISTSVSLFIDNTDIPFFMYKTSVGFSQKQAEQMATARAWCRWMTSQLQNDNFKKLGIYKKQDFYQICCDIIAPMELEGFKVSSAAYLRNKLDSFPAYESINAQREFFISGKYGNANAQIVGKYPLFDEETGQIFDFDIHQAIMFRLYMNPGGSTKEYIRQLWERYYLEDVREFEQNPVSYRTFCHHLSRFNRQLQLSRTRHGQEWYKKNVLTYVTNEKLKYAHSLFAGDGSGTINYKYVKSNGQLSSMKLYIIMISDIASRKIVGWAAAPKGQHKETFEMTRDAVKMAIETCGQQTMFEFVSDNHGAFASGEAKAFLNLVFNKVRTIEPGNSQANPAETEFRLFKRSLKDIQNFLSTSWDAGIEGQANPDHLNVDDLPTYEDALIQIHELIKRWNAMPLRDGVTPDERFENKHPECRPMEPVVLRYLFGNHTEVDISYMRGYVNVYKANGYDTTKFQFEIPQYGGAGTEMIAKALGYTSGAKLKVVWTKEMADLYTLDGKFILSCPPALKSSQSHAEMDDSNEYALGHHLNRKKNQSGFVDEFENSLNDIWQGLNYETEMALGSNKETYNGEMINREASNIKKSAKKRIERDFNDSDWSDLNQ